MDKSLKITPLRREFYFFTLYRQFESALLVFFVFSPLILGLREVRHPLFAQSIALAYLVLAGVLFALGRRSSMALEKQVRAGVALDVGVALVALHCLEGFQTGVALLLVVNIGAGALLLPLRSGIGFAVAAGAGVIGEYLMTRLIAYEETVRSFPESVMFAVTYLAIATLCHLLGRQMRDTQALAEQRGVDIANLSQINELIIRRMRTGVLVVDDRHQIRLVNEAAWFLLGMPSPDRRDLHPVAPALSDRLRRWQESGENDHVPLALAKEAPEVIPRFTRLTTHGELFLIFLDDTALLSRRAEQMTLSSLGRLSASIAHEIRNPLAAISYSAQLLEESPALDKTDVRLIEIIRNHCRRMNGIVEDILSLSRREHSRPETLDIRAWIMDFMEEFKAGRDLGQDQLHISVPDRPLYAVMDPQHLHQVMTNLIVNALTHGRFSGEPARIAVNVRQSEESGQPIAEIIDHGPGIPPSVAGNIFEPFYTTREYGTGLGLYLARQLCEANQATLAYAQPSEGGSCFRISLAKAASLAHSFTSHLATR